MPRKTRRGGHDAGRPAARFNEAAARCRGKLKRAAWHLGRMMALQ